MGDRGYRGRGHRGGGHFMREDHRDRGYGFERGGPRNFDDRPRRPRSPSPPYDRFRRSPPPEFKRRRGEEPDYPPYGRRPSPDYRRGSPPRFPDDREYDRRELPPRAGSPPREREERTPHLMSYKEFMVKRVPDDVSPDEAAKLYQGYLVEFYGSAIKSEFEQHRNDDALRSQFDPRYFESLLARKMDDARDTAAALAADIRSGKVDPTHDAFAQGMYDQAPKPDAKASHADDGPRYAPNLCWRPQRVQVDLRLSRRLMVKLDEEKGITDNPLLQAVQPQQDAPAVQPAEAAEREQSEPPAAATAAAAAAGGDEQPPPAGEEAAGKEEDMKPEAEAAAGEEGGPPVDGAAGGAADASAVKGEAAGSPPPPGPTGPSHVSAPSLSQRPSASLSPAEDPLEVSEDNLAASLAKLDMQLTWLWRVHGVDYYSGHELVEHEWPYRLTACRLIRGPCPEDGEQQGGNPALQAEELARIVDECWQRRIPEGDPVEARCQRRRVDEEVDKWIDSQVTHIADNKWGSKLSSKMFVGRKYVVKHIRTKHEDKIVTEKERIYDELYFEAFRVAREEEEKQRQEEEAAAAAAAAQQEEEALPQEEAMMEEVMDPMGGMDMGMGLGMGGPMVMYQPGGRGMMGMRGRGMMGMRGRGMMGMRGRGPMAIMARGMLGMDGPLIMPMPAMTPMMAPMMMPAPAPFMPLMPNPMMAPMPMVPRGGRGGRMGMGPVLRGGRMGGAGRGGPGGGFKEYFDLDAPANNRAVLDYGDL